MARVPRDEARRRSRRGEVVSLQDERTALKEVLASDEATADEKLQQSEQIDQLQEALEELPEMDREIIMLRHYGQMSFIIKFHILLNLYYLKSVEDIILATTN